MVAALVWVALVPQPARVTLFNTADANDWIEAADRHQPGVVDEPLKKIAGWAGDRLVRTLAIVKETPSSDSVNAHLERAAMLHADISFLSRDSLEPLPEGSWPIGGAGLLVQDGQRVGRQHLDPHLAFGRRIIAAMRPPAPSKGWLRPDPKAERLRIRNWLAAHARNPRIRQWYRAVSADLASVQWVADLQPHLSDAHGLLEEDAGHHFDAGCMAELIASPQIQHVVPKPTASKLNSLALRAELDSLALAESFNLSEAEREYRDSLKIDPAYDEARVRLARVLSLRGRHREALDLLQAPIASREEPVRYYRQLILAEALEREGRVREAHDAYLEASGMFPLAQSALIPRIRLARELADDASGKLAVARMAALPRPESGRDDPWWGYYACNGRNRDRELEALWQLFKERKP